MVTKSAGEAELARQLDALGIDYETEYRYAPPRRWRADFRIAQWLIEIEGGAWNGGHRRGIEANKDCERANAAQLDNWKVLRFTPYMVETGEAIETIQAALGRV
jgi:very-short-patch-repair endonuclease